jgi:hypothetical protein
MLEDNTNRRFAILMTAISDFMTAYQEERNQLKALLNIQQKVEQKAPTKKSLTTFKADEKKPEKKP